MSIEPQNSKPAKGLLTLQKLEALKDALANRKTVKIKPVTVEFRQHFVTMKENYESIVREKMAKAQATAEMEKTKAPVHNTVTPEHQRGKLLQFNYGFLTERVTVCLIIFCQYLTAL